MEAPSSTALPYGVNVHSVLQQACLACMACASRLHVPHLSCVRMPGQGCKLHLLGRQRRAVHRLAEHLQAALPLQATTSRQRRQVVG